MQSIGKRQATPPTLRRSEHSKPGPLDKPPRSALRPKTDNSRRNQAPRFTVGSRHFSGANPYSTSPPHTQTQLSLHLTGFCIDERLILASVCFFRYHTSFHTLAGPWCLPPPVSVPVRSISPYFRLDMPPPRLFIRFCTVWCVPLSSTTGPSFPCFSRENGPALFAITYLIPYLGRGGGKAQAGGR